jgi:hypothetical protein
LVDLDNAEAGRRVIANSKPRKLTGYVVAQDSLYDVVRRTEKTAGMPGLWETKPTGPAAHDNTVPTHSSSRRDQGSW